MVVMHENVPTPTCTVEPLAHSKDVTFVQALNDKYVNQEEFANHFKLPKDRSISTEITFVGFHGVTNVQKQLRKLVSIDLSGRGISTAGDLTSISGSLNGVTTLNLADNRLTWQEVITIVACLTNLQEIILTGNDLRANVSIDYPLKPFRKLISIILGRVELEWSSVVSILSRIWTSVDQIDLWDNHLKDHSFKLNEDSPFVGEIKSLKLGQNCFLDLSWLVQAGQFDNLEELDVSHCQIEFIDLDMKTVHQLRNLRLLNISHNNISDWSSLSTLNQLANLKHLIWTDNPVFITSKSVKALTVGRIASLTQLNREEITASFRRDSEIFYLRQTFRALQESKNLDVCREHPRYNELIENYGVPEDLIAKQVFEKYIRVDLCMGGNTIAKKLPCDMRVSNLQMLCKRLFKLKPSANIEIVCCEKVATDEAVTYTLDNEGQTLHFFSVKSNHKLVINQLE